VALVLYLPEAAAAVLFPRIAAAAQGARDADETRRQVVQVHRLLMVGLPVLIGPGVLFAPWVLGWALPKFAASIEPLRVLAVAALVMSMATLPSYYLLGSSRSPWTLVVPALTALAAAAAIFGTAILAPGATSVAWAATAGYAAFSLAMLGLATPRLTSEPRDRAALWAGTLIPVAWAAGLTLWLSRTPDAALVGAMGKSLGFLALYAPVALVFGGMARRRHA
jgi:O-antigen/teichoic acid export membrane protein